MLSARVGSREFKVVMLLRLINDRCNFNRNSKKTCPNRKIKSSTHFVKHESVAYFGNFCERKDDNGQKRKTFFYILFKRTKYTKCKKSLNC